MEGIKPESLRRRRPTPFPVVGGGALEQQLLRDVGRAIGDFRLIENGDRIMVALSGGKDSYAMLTLLRHLQRRSPVAFDLVAVHLDQKQPGYDGAPLVEWLRKQDVEYYILEEDTYSIVRDKVPEGKTYCSLCSRLRRGVLYSAADQLDCDKVALGHHRDDTIETLLLNLFFAGKTAAMPARLESDDGAHTVIRPLIYVAESDLEIYAREHKFPIIPCNLCGTQDNAQRARIKRLLDDLELTIPNVRSSLMAALGNVNPSHLLDRDLHPVPGPGSGLR